MVCRYDVDFLNCPSDGPWFKDCISYTHKLENVCRFAYFSCRQLAFRSQRYADLTSSKGSWKF